MNVPFKGLLLGLFFISVGAHLVGTDTGVHILTSDGPVTLTLSDGGEVLEARWFPVDQLPRLTPNTEQLLGVYGIGPAAARMRTSEADPAGGNAAEHQAAAQTVTVQNAAAPGITVPDAASDGPAAAGTPDGDSGTEASAEDRRG